MKFRGLKRTNEDVVERISVKLKEIKRLELAFFLGTFILSSFLNFAAQRFSVPSTDTNQIYLFSDLLVRNQTLDYYNELNAKYDTPIFGIRSLLNFGENTFVPSVLPGIIILHALFKFMGIPTFLINPIFVFMGLLFFNKIVNTYIFHSRFWSLFTTVIYLFSGAFIFTSSLPFKDLVATATFLGGLYYILNGIHDRRIASFILFGFFAGITMWMCYPNVIFYLPAVLLYIAEVRSHIFERRNLDNLVASLSTFLLLFVPFYAYQVSLFGGFLNFSNPAFRLNHYEAFNVQSGSIFSFILDINGTKLLENFYNQFFLVNHIIISLSIVGLSLILDDVRKRRVNGVLLALLVLVAIQFLLYLGKDWSGVFFEGSVGTSYSRYLLISWGVLITLSVYAVKSFVLRRPILILLCIYLIFSGITTGLYSRMAVESWIYTGEWAYRLRNDIVENTPPNSIVFASFYDKFIYPARQTAIYVAIPEEERVEKTMWLMKELLEDGYPVYIVDERDEYAISPITNRDVFTENGLETQRAFGIFYRVMISNNPNGTEKT